MDAYAVIEPAVSEPENPIPEPDLSKYFALKPHSEIAASIQSKADDYFKYLRETRWLYLMRRSELFYYRGAVTGGQLYATGDQGEFTNINPNHFRNILLHILSGATSQRPALAPVAANSDYKSLAQSRVARNVLDHYNRSSLETKLKAAAEISLYMGEAYLTMDWDTDLGSDFALGADGRPVKDGDILMGVHSPLSVITDYANPDSDTHDWFIIREMRNKYQLAAKYRAHAKEILAYSIPADDIYNRRTVQTYNSFEDLVFVDTLIHARTPVLPDGRYVKVVGSKTVLMDTALPFKKIPVYPMMAEKMNGSSRGYTIAFDLLPIQDAYDKACSMVLSQIATFGGQNIWTPAGAALSLTDLGGGMKHIQSAQKPEPLNLLQLSPELLNFIERYEKLMETISGVNSVVRGNPESSLKSGSALALVASQAIQFNSNFQQAYNRLVENAGTGLLDMLKSFAKTKRMISIAGKSNAGYMAEFTGSDISEIDRVHVELANPISRTTAGKLQIAQDLLQVPGMIKSPQEYLQVLMSGTLDPMVEGDQAELLLIKQENENLSMGKKAVAMITDNHVLHIQEHGVVLSSPESRKDPGAVSVALEHINAHLMMLRTGDPGILSINKQPQLPPMMPPGMAPPAPPPPGAPAEALGPISETMDPTNPTVQAAEGVDLPNMPKDPLSGERMPGIPA